MGAAVDVAPVVADVAVDVAAVAVVLVAVVAATTIAAGGTWDAGAPAGAPGVAMPDVAAATPFDSRSWSVDMPLDLLLGEDLVRRSKDLVRRRRPETDPELERGAADDLGPSVDW